MTEIRPLLVNHEDNQGGAARAMYRLHEGLLGAGVDSRIVAGYKFSDDPTVQVPWLYRSKVRRNLLGKLERLPKHLYLNAPRMPWSTNLISTLGSSEFNRSQYNLINFHWIGGGFVPI